jgi:ribosomal protein L37E
MNGNAMPLSALVKTHERCSRCGVLVPTHSSCPSCLGFSKKREQLGSAQQAEGKETTSTRVIVL